MPTHLNYHIIKSEPLGSDDLNNILGERLVKLRAVRFPTSVNLLYLVEMVVRTLPNDASESPGLQLSTPGQDFSYANIGYNLDFGFLTFRHANAVGYRLFFTISLPAGAAESLLHVVFFGVGGSEIRNNVGAIRVRDNDRIFEVHEKFLLTAPMERQSASYSFVGGAPKSGTTWVQFLLNGHPDCLSLGEGEFFGLVKDIHYRRTNHWLPPAAEVEDIQDLFHLGAMRILTDFYTRVIPVKLVVDKSPGNAKRYSRILELTPNARLAHCIRHPLDVIVSRAYHEIKLVEDGAGSELEEHREAVSEIADELRETGQLKLRMSGAGCWALIRSIADDWIDSQREAIKVRRAQPDRIRILRYESMLADPFETTHALFEFFGLTTDPKLVALCVEQASFENLTTRRPGTEDRASFFRVGRANQFLDVFERDGMEDVMTYIREALGEDESAREFDYSLE